MNIELVAAAAFLLGMLVQAWRTSNNFGCSVWQAVKSGGGPGEEQKAKSGGGPGEEQRGP